MTDKPIYRKAQDRNDPRPLRTPGPVLYWESEHGKAVIFSCPCGEREVYVTSPPHTKIEFDADGRLTIEASCGYHAKPALGRPANWCHFHMTDGQVEMCGDAQCPGAGL